MTVNSSILHYYKHFRQHQNDCLTNVDQGGGTYFKLPNGKWFRKEITGGGAAEGQHAYAAYMSARRRIHFNKTYLK